MASNLERRTTRLSNPKVQECDSLHHLHDFRSLFHKASLGCIAIVSTKLTLSKSSLSYRLPVLAPHNMERQGPRSASGPSPQERNAEQHNYLSQETASNYMAMQHISQICLDGIVLPGGLKKSPFPLVESDSSFLMRVSTGDNTARSPPPGEPIDQQPVTSTFFYAWLLIPPLRKDTNENLKS